MGAPKLKKSKCQKQKNNKTQKNDNKQTQSNADKQMIESLKNAISKKLEHKDNVKKAAQIITELLNSSS